MNDHTTTPPVSSEIPNIHDGLGLNDSARRLLRDATVSKLEEVGLRLHGELSHGATAVVFEAKELATGRRVAVKVIHTPNDQRAMSFFRRECRILSSDYIPKDLVPNYYTSHGFSGSDADDAPSSAASDGAQPFIAMELIDGKKIHDYSRKPRLMPMWERVELVEQLFRTLNRLHDCNLLHGDLSSNNVLVESAGQIRFVDFGQSRRLSAGYESRNSVSGPTGTEGFAPHAQLSGEEKGSRWADIRAASAIAFHVLTGELPTGASVDNEKQWRSTLSEKGVPRVVAATILRGLRDKDCRTDGDTLCFVSAENPADELASTRQKRVKRSRILRQTLVAFAVLIPLMFVGVIGWQKYTAATNEQNLRTLGGFREQVAGLPNKSHGAIESLVAKANELESQRIEASESGDSSTANRLLGDELRILGQAVEVSRGLEQCQPMHRALGEIIVKTPWVTESPVIAAKLNDVTGKYKEITTLIESGDTSTAWSRLSSLQAELVKQTQENSLAEEGRVAKATFDRLSTSVAERMKTLDGYETIGDFAQSGKDAWEQGEWSEASKLLGHARQRMKEWLEANETPEEKAARNALAASDIVSLEREKSELQMQIENLQESREAALLTKQSESRNVEKAREHWANYWHHYYTGERKKSWNEIVLACSWDPTNPVYRTVKAVNLADGSGVEQDWDKAIEISQGCLEELLRIDPKSGEVCDAIGNFYSRGLGVNKDHREAFRWWKEGAEKGFPPNMIDIGLAYCNGEPSVFEQDVEEGFKWLEKAAEKKNPYAMFAVAECLASGTGTSHDPKRALDFLKQSAEMNCTPAINRFAKVLLDKDKDEALEWLVRGANLEDYECRYLLGAIYLQGEIVNKDIEKSKRYLEQAALVETGEEERSAAVFLAVMLLKGNEFDHDEARAKALLEAAASRNTIAAFPHLHRLYLRGYRSIVKDESKAFALAKKYAEQEKFPLAVYQMANAYRDGIGVDRDVHQAIMLYEQLAEDEDDENAAVALFEIAEIYIRGTRDKEIMQSELIAKTWYRKAAEKGHGQSANLLARILQEEGSKDEAEKWFSKGEELGWPRGLIKDRVSRARADTFRRLMESAQEIAEKREEETENGVDVSEDESKESDVASEE